eukprot:5024927-Pyramimonas_sp.AAC.2
MFDHKAGLPDLETSGECEASGRDGTMRDDCSDAQPPSRLDISQIHALTINEHTRLGLQPKKPLDREALRDD